jgi:hypothetical protein
VVAFPGATDAAWPLAQAIYSDRGLRTDTIAEGDARVMCGEAPPADAPTARRDLAQTVAALRGDDAPTRLLLGEIARRFALRGVVSVWMDGGGHVSAHVFLPESGTFDAAAYSPDDGPTIRWSAAARSLDRMYAIAPESAGTNSGVAPVERRPAAPAGVAGVSPPPLATHEVPEERSRGHAHFYESPWFWAGLGAAAAAAAAIYLSTRDTSSPTIHLELQVPK